MLTRGEPVYYVTSGPMYGALRKRDDVTRTRRDSRDSSRPRGKHDRKRKTQKPKYIRDALMNFTHEDVARGYVIYYPPPPTTENLAILEDEFTFVLTAPNAQPVIDSLAIEVVPADYNIMSASPAMRSSTASGQPSSSSTDGGVDKILIVLVVAVLTLLALVGLVIFTCIRCRRAAKRRKMALAAAIDGSETAPVTSLSVDQRSGAGNAGLDDGTGFLRPSMLARRGAPPPPSLPVIIEPTSTDSDGEGSPTASTAAAAVIPNSPPSDSGAPRTGYVRVLPPSPPTSPAGLQQNGAPPGTPGDGRHGPRSVWKEQVTYDWEHVDPELLQHCRKTNPVLHKNQYWV